MPLRIICPSCGRSGRAPDNALGRNALCPACGTRYKITARVLAQEVPVAELDEPPPPQAAAPARSSTPVSPRPKPKPVPEASEYPDLPREPWPVLKPVPPRPEPSRPLWLYAAIAGGGVAAFAVSFLCVYLLFIRGGSAPPATFSSTKNGWATFTPPEGGFSVAMPGRPQPANKKEKLPNGTTLEHHVFVADARPSNFAISYVDLGIDVDPASVKQFLDRVRDDSTRARRARVLEEHDVDLDGHPGRERIEIMEKPGGGLTFKVRVFLVGRRLYTLVAARPKSAEDSSDSDRFLLSFRLKSEGQQSTPESSTTPDATIASTGDSEAEGPSPSDAPPAPKVAGRTLRYAWKPSTTYVYSVHIDIQAGKVSHSLDGSSVYRVKEADDSGATLVNRGWLVTRRRTKDGSPPPGGAVSGPGNPTQVEIKLSPEGRPLSTNGEAPLPLLGDLAMLVIEPLSESESASWEEASDIALNEVHVDPAGPMRAGRPSLRDRLAAGRASTRLRASSRLRRGQRSAPQPPAQNVSVTSHRAHETSTYALVAESGDTVTIAKRYVLETEEKEAGKPRLQMVGNGTITFDAKKGIPRSFDFKAVVTSVASNATVRIPFDVRCRLLEGAEREKALNPPVMPPTAMEPISEADVARAVADLKSGDNGRCKRGAQRLFNAAPIDTKREEVAEALEGLLDDRDGFLRSDVIRALGVWGDAETAPLLVERLNDDKYGARGELFEALGRIGPADATVQAMIAWLLKDAGGAGRVLRAIGPAAEPALLKVVQGDADPRLRAEACRVLRDVGTSRSLEVLKGLVQSKNDEETGRYAQNVLRRIDERTLSDARLTVLVEDLKASDNGKRVASAERLASATPVEARRAEVSRALEPLLDINDRRTQGVAARALGVWGDSKAATVLAQHVRDRSFDEWREAASALARIAKDEPAVEAIASRVNDDRGHVFRIFETMGPVAEKAVIAIVESNADWPVRADACNLLKTIGTARSVPALKATAANKRDGIPAGAAEAVLKTLAERKMTVELLNDTLARLKSSDPNRRRESLERLGNAEPEASRRAKVARAVEEALRADPDDNLQRLALKVLTRWGDERTIPALADRIDDRDFRPWREAAETLSKLAPGDPSAAIILGRYKDDSGHILRLLREMKPFPEKTLLHTFLEPATDMGERRELSLLLENFGTGESASALKDVAARVGVGEVGSAAEEAVRGIEQRQ